jgi:hypothetical protein
MSCDGFNHQKQFGSDTRTRKERQFRQRNDWKSRIV